MILLSVDNHSIFCIILFLRLESLLYSSFSNCVTVCVCFVSSESQNMIVQRPQWLFLIISSLRDFHCGILAGRFIVLL